MNIDEFRAMKAEQEKGSNDAQTQPTATDTGKAEQTEIATPQGEGVQTPTPTKVESQEDTVVVDTPSTEQPTTIEIDGKEVSIDELKNGYLRQSDYTKKTQEIQSKARQAEQAMKFMEQLQQNPQVAEQLSQQLDMPNLNPQHAQVQELQHKYYDLLVQTELRDLHDKYGEFEDREVLEIARDKNIENLEDAYLLAKGRKPENTSNEPSLNIDEIKAQLRDELMQELKQSQEANVDTSSIIERGGNDTPVRDNSPKLSAQELKVASMMGMKPEDYATWRDIKNKK